MKTSLVFHWRGLLLALLPITVLLITSTYNVSAQKHFYGNSVPSGSVIQTDVVLTGNNVIIDGTVIDDVLAIGNNITVNGTVEDSLVAIAQTIRINAGLMALPIR